MNRRFITGAMVLHTQLTLRSLKVVVKDESLQCFIIWMNIASRLATQTDSLVRIYLDTERGIILSVYERRQEH
jgi:hypothetical protein